MKAPPALEDTVQSNTEDEDQTCLKQYSQPWLYSQGRPQFTPCPNRKWPPASRNSKCSMPAVDELSNHLQAAPDMNAKNGCYVSSRHKQNTGKTNTGTIPLHHFELNAMTSDKDGQLQQSEHNVSGKVNKHESQVLKLSQTVF